MLARYKKFVFFSLFFVVVFAFALPESTPDDWLLSASKNNRPLLVKVLLYVVPDVNITDKDGYSPLMYAIRNNNVEMAKLLLEKGGKVDLTKMNGFAPELPEGALRILRDNSFLVNERAFYSFFRELENSRDWNALLLKYSDRFYINTPYGVLTVRRATKVFYDKLYQDFKNAFSPIEKSLR